VWIEFTIALTTTSIVRRNDEVSAQGTDTAPRPSLIVNELAPILVITPRTVTGVPLSTSKLLILTNGVTPIFPSCHATTVAETTATNNTMMSNTVVVDIFFFLGIQIPIAVNTNPLKIITLGKANTKGSTTLLYVVVMDVSERYVRLCGEVSNFTKAKTGVSFVDAYIGPENLDPEKQSKNRAPEEFVHDIQELVDQVKGDVDTPLRSEHLVGECRSMVVTVEWLNGKDITYADLVQGLFNIPLKRFSESVIDKKIEDLEEALQKYQGTDLRDRVDAFTKEGEISGADLKQLVERDLQTKALEVGNLFQKKVYSLIGTSVTDNGVEYQTVTDTPWSGYNWYQKGFKSLNQFNIDVTFNKNSLQSVIYHEYEHHVSNLWREKYFRESGNLELAVVPLHTGRCVISEGTADTAKEFLGVVEEDPHIEIADALYTLRRMTSINAATMLNAEGKSTEEAIEYMFERGYRTEKSAKGSMGFIGPKMADGRPNFWAPYVFTYFFGRTDFVLPTFNKAVQEDELAKFYQTLYLNPYSGSSVTWRKAFDWLN